MSDPITLDIRDILNTLPHRYPFLMVDRVEELIPGERIRAYKNLTYNEAFFQGHFPGIAVMPGVLIIEALAQAGILLVVHSLPEVLEHLDDHIYLFTGIEKARFRASVHPGDRLTLECFNLSHRLNFWKMSTRAYVEDTLVAEANLSASMLPREIN